MWAQLTADAKATGISSNYTALDQGYTNLYAVIQRGKVIVLQRLELNLQSILPTQVEAGL